MDGRAEVAAAVSGSACKWDGAGWSAGWLPVSFIWDLILRGGWVLRLQLKQFVRKKFCGILENGIALLHAVREQWTKARRVSCHIYIV